MNWSAPGTSGVKFLEREIFKWLEECEQVWMKELLQEIGENLVIWGVDCIGDKARMACWSHILYNPELGEECELLNVVH